MFYYFGRSVDTNLYPLVMPSVLMFFYWLYALRTKALFIPKADWLCGVVLFSAFLFYTVSPLLPTGSDMVRPALVETAQRFLKTSQDLPRDEAFAKNAEQLMDKYSGDQKYLAYFFGEKGIEVALYDHRSKIYPYDDIDQPSLSDPTLERILSTHPALKPGDYVYTSPDMGDPKPILGTSLNLEQTLLQQLDSRYFLRLVETSGTIRVYKIVGEKAKQIN